MKKVDGWTNHGTNSEPHFDYVPSAKWSTNRIASERHKQIAVIDELASSGVSTIREPWVTVLKSLPKTLLNILSIELHLGNSIVSISKDNWPSQGSVVVRLGKPFHADTKGYAPNVGFRNLNDPHYCEQELSEEIDGTEYLLIT